MCDTIRNIFIPKCLFIFMAWQPLVGQVHSLSRFRDHSQTQYTRYDRTAPCLRLFGFLNPIFRHIVGHLVWRIGPSQSLYLHGTAVSKRSLNQFLGCSSKPDRNVWASQDGTCRSTHGYGSQSCLTQIKCGSIVKPEVSCSPLLAHKQIDDQWK